MPPDPAGGTPDSLDLEIDERYLLEVFGSVEQAKLFLRYARENDVLGPHQERTDEEEEDLEEEEEVENEQYCGVAHHLPSGLHKRSEQPGPSGITSSDFEVDERYLLEVFGSVEQAEQFLRHVRENDVFGQGA